MKTNAIFLPAFLLLFLFSSCETKTASVLKTTKVPLSIRMAESEIKRNPDAILLDFTGGKLRWNYTTGLELLAFIDLYKQCGDERFLNYAYHYADTMIDQEGRIASYTLSKHNIDHVCPGRILMPLYDMTGQERFKTAMDTLFQQLKTQPRTSDGGFWHKRVYPYQMWLDGLYMGEPYYAEYVSRYVPENERQAYYDDIVHQFVTVGKHTYDPVHKVYRHGWDETKSMFWADKESGQSAQCWGRGLGWYVMGMVDALDYLPESADRQAVIDLLHQIYHVLPDYADKKTEMWYQVLECPGQKDNYLEATGSIMFVYALLKGVKTGIFDEKYTFLAQRWYRKFVECFVIENPDGTISITNCCAGAGLGGSEKRSGTYDYYVHQTEIRNDDCKAVGPFIWASMYYEELRRREENGQ